MKEENKRIISNSKIILLRLVITSIVGLYTTRLLVSELGTSHYGIYIIISSVVVMMEYLNTIMTTTTYRYIAFELGKGDKGSLGEIFNITFVIHFGIALIMVVASLTIGEFYIKNILVADNIDINEIILIYRLFVAASFATILNAPYQGLLIAMERFSFKALVEIMRSILYIPVLLILPMFNNKLIVFSILSVIILLLRLGAIILYCRKINYNVVKLKFQTNWPKYREMFGFTFWILIGGVSNIGKSQGSSLIINYYFGTVLNAAFGVANQVNGMLFKFSKVITQASVPQITKSYSSGNIDRSLSVSLLISKYTFFIMLLISMPILLESNYILSLWLRQVPEYSSEFIVLMIMIALFDSINSGFPAIVHASGKIKWFHVFGSILVILSLVAAIILFSFGFPPYYIFISYLLFTGFLFLLNLILYKTIIHIDIKLIMNNLYLKSFFVVISVLPLFFFKYYFQESFYRFLIISMVSFLVTSASIYFLGLNKRERNIIILQLKTLINKKK